MKNLKITLLLSFLAVCQLILADIPPSYYSSIDGDICRDLKRDLNAIISNHKTLGYSSLWEHYPNSYYHLDDPQRVYDMYSNIKRYYSGSSVVSGMNKEHTVPKSWWGGSTSAQPGNDLYNVIPSDQDANSRKSNYPLGIVKDQSWTNGVTTVGKGTVNGYSTTFFEPCDEYKGDFARIYFYMATCYPKIWENDTHCMDNNNELTLKSWIIPMLIEWNTMDPVDAREIQCNEDVYKIQGNRNPFIDYPVLADYIWGGKQDEAFLLAEHEANEGGETEHVAAIPSFSLPGGTESMPKEVVSGTKVIVKGGSPKAYLYVRVNDGTWMEIEPETGWNATSETEYYVNASYEITLTEDTKIEAYSTQEGFAPSASVYQYYRVVDFSNDYLLYEPFDEVINGKNNTTSGSSHAWSGNDNFPYVNSQVYEAGNALRLASSKSEGKLESRELMFAGGSLSVSVDVKGWTTVEGTLDVSVTGGGTQNVEYSATMADDFETHTVLFNNVSQNPKVTITTNGGRAFLDNVKVTGSKTDAISDVHESSSSMVIYDLRGQRISTPQHGVYIINGRKVMR